MSTLTARLFGRHASVDRPIVPAPAEPMGVARATLRALFTDSHDNILLREHRADLYRWNGTYWPSIETRDLRAAVYQFLEHAQYVKSDEGLKAFAPTRRKIDDVIDATRAIVNLDSARNVPMWTESIADDPPASEIVSMANGLLHLPTRTLIPHTPRFFAHHALPFPFIADAPLPRRWMDFMHELWPDDESSIAALQDMTGYLVAGNTRLQKIPLIVGPARAGKGTYGRVLTGLLGSHNVVAPTLASLATNFGMQELIGRSLAIVSDARFASRADGCKVVVERLLSVSGEDSLTIDRKHREPWTGRLSTRFLILTNELPRLIDSSAALASRFVVFVLTRSFRDQENPNLTDELLSEAPSIFNWALHGLDRLNARGYFVSPDSGKEAVQQLEELSSPTLAFVRDRCEIGPQFEIRQQHLFESWKRWCGENGRQHPGTIQTFGRDLHAARPDVTQVQHRDDCGVPRRYYAGLRLRD